MHPKVGKRVFTCVTTPPALGSFFAVFIDSVKEANKKDDYFFRLVNHSLACADCLEKGKARECTHNLRFIPRAEPLGELLANQPDVP